MTVQLLQYNDLAVTAHAIRTCWQSFDKSDDGGEKDKELIHRVGNKFKHASTLEHLSYSFYIQGISRACLQELARHRIASLSVKSTRYTLKELKNNPPLMNSNQAEGTYWLWDEIDKYIVLTGEYAVDTYSAMALANLKDLLEDGVPNDQAKYALPESYKTELTWTINARSLQNFLYLRSSKSALWEIQHLANAIFQALPKDHKYIFEDFIQEKTQ